jgi:hypothetical protein
LADEPEEELTESAEGSQTAATIAQMAADLAGAAESDAPATVEPGIAEAVEAEVVEAVGADASAANVQPHRLHRILRLRARLRRPQLRLRRPAVRLAIVARFALVAALVAGTAGSAGPIVAPRSVVPDFVAAASPVAAPTAASPTTAPTAAPEPAGSIAPLPSFASPSPSPTQTGPTRTSPTATITFSDLMLAAAGSTGPSGTVRTFAFASDGPGTVSAEIVSSAPITTTIVCLFGDAVLVGCDAGGTPGVSQAATTTHSQWLADVISLQADAPTVDVRLSWPADHPQISLGHALFRGQPSPDSMRSVTANFKTRRAGDLSLDALWPSTGIDATLTVTDMTGSKPLPIDSVLYSDQSGTAPSYTLSVRANRTYSIELYNLGTAGAQGNLQATIAFP